MCLVIERLINYCFVVCEFFVQKKGRGRGGIGVLRGVLFKFCMFFFFLAEEGIRDLTVTGV